MRPLWLIEADVFGMDVEPLRVEIRRQGMACQTVRHSSLSYNLHEFASAWSVSDRDCVLFYGSFPLMEFIRTRTEWIPGGWCTPENLDCSTYYGHYGAYLLNRHYMLLPGVEVLRLQEWIFATLAREDRVFVRPSGCTKLFKESTVTREELAPALAPSRYDPATLVLVAEPRRIDREWRLVVAEDRVVAASQYSRDGEIEMERGCPATVIDFAETLLREIRWRPDPMFVLDVADVDGELAVVEVNGFSCAGLYLCDLREVVAAASDLAARKWAARSSSVPVQ